MSAGKVPDRSDDRNLTHRSLLIFGVFAAIVVLIVLAWYLVQVLLLVFAGVLLGILLRTPADWLAQRTPLPPGAALALVIVSLAAVLGGGVWLFGAPVADQMAQLIQRIPEIFADVKGRLEQYDWIIREILPRNFLENGPEFVGVGARVVTTTFGAIAGFGIAVIMGIFFAIQPDVYVKGFVQLVPVHQRRRAEEVMYAIGHILRWWLVGQLCLMLAVGVLTGIGLWLLEVPLALALAVVAALLTFIPYLGPILSAIPALLVALSESTLLAGYVLLLYIAVQSIEGYILEPIVQRKAVYLPPALILFAQIVLGVLVGVLGIMLATPLAAAFMVAVKMLYVEDVLGAKPIVPAEAGADAARRARG